MTETLGGLLAARAADEPDRPYLHFQGQVHSRARLHREAMAHAAALAARGVKPGERVALLLPNGPDFVIAFFGNAIAGAVTVPLNTNLKGPELAYQIEKTRAVALIYHPAFAGSVAALQRLPFLTLRLCAGKPPFKDGTLKGLAAEGAEIVARQGAFVDRAKPGDVAAILFTSGTTGNPKGAMLTHRNYIANARQLATFTGMGPSDRPLCVLPLFHVNAQVVTMVTPLYAGAETVLLPGFQKDSFLRVVAESRATSFSAVPTIYALLLTLPDRDSYDLSSLRYCICGAAPMPVEVFERFEKTFRTNILEGYGLTEGTCASCVNPVAGPRKVGTIGVPLPEQEVRLLDDAGKEGAQGQVGEICVRGENVMAGYFEDPEATARAIVDGWLHTGDLGTRDADGYLTIVGRKKEMIIRGGENIYPKEIEEACYTDARVLEAAAVGIPDRMWGEEVALFVVARPDAGGLDEAGLRKLLAARLADFKCPRHVVFRQALPKTATGKIRKGELRDDFLRQGG